MRMGEFVNVLVVSLMIFFDYGRSLGACLRMPLLCVLCESKISDVVEDAWFSSVDAIAQAQKWASSKTEVVSEALQQVACKSMYELRLRRTYATQPGAV